MSPRKEIGIFTTVYAVCAHMAGGSAVDLLLFPNKRSAENYVKTLLRPLPLGFDSVEVVERTILG